MAKLDDLEATVDTLIADQAKFITDVQTALQAAIAGSGADTAHFDAVMAKITQADAAIKAADQSVTNPTIPVQTPATPTTTTTP